MFFLFQIFVGKGNRLSFVDGFYCCVFSVFLCCTVYNITVCIFNLFPFQDCFSAFCVLDRVQFYFCFVSSLCLVVLIIVDVCFCFRCLCLGFFLYFYQIFDRILQMSDRFVYCCLCMRCFQLIFCFCQLCLKRCPARSGVVCFTSFFASSTTFCSSVVSTFSSPLLSDTMFSDVACTSKV